MTSIVQKRKASYTNVLEAVEAFTAYKNDKISMLVT